MIQGIKITGLKIIGTPKIKGSDIPKNAGATATLPTAFKRYDLANNNIHTAIEG